MIILNDKLYSSEKVIKMTFSNDWSKSDTSIMTKCILNKFKSYLENCKDENKKVILIIDTNKGEIPPMSQLISIFKEISSMKSEIEHGMNFTIVYSESDNYQKWLDIILKIYKPIKPLKIAKNKKEIISLINSK